MLDKFSYVFIVGAGAGKPYALPTGKELYLHLQQNCYETQSSPSMPPRYLPKGDWMTYLFERMHRGLNTPEDLFRLHENNHVAFITFNYDRSLEHFLFSALWGLVKNSKTNINDETQWKAVADVIKQIPIIHVYGKIGKLPWEADYYQPGQFRLDDVVSYGHDAQGGRFGVLALRTYKMIDLIYDERKNNPVIENAKKLISSSDRVFFLGFGYDEMNLSILGLPDLLKNKHVWGTALNSTGNEIYQIERKLRPEKFPPELEIKNCDCLMLLREHLI